MDSKTLRDCADSLFSKRAQLHNLWQEIAENFYPERGDFTVRRHLGDDWAAGLASSHPPLVRRDLGDTFETMLRNSSKEWMEMTVRDASRRLSHEGKAWLQWATGLQRAVMADRPARFSGSAKAVDHDLAAFGNGVIRVRANSDWDGLLYHDYHLRDVAWMDDEAGNPCAIFRRWKPEAHQLVQLMRASALHPGRQVHRNVERLAAKRPFETVNCLHMMVRDYLFDGDSRRMPWRSIYYDTDNKLEMESVPQWNKEYCIVRWARLGSQYAHSPATVVALPEARLLQAMQLTLLEAGEKIVNPPMVAVDGAVRSDMSVYAGGVTWIEYSYDERTGEALRPLTTDVKGMPLSRDMMNDSRNLLAQCFYLNKLRPFLPTDKQMTAFQASEIIAQYIRDALPLFAPLEPDYNGEVCEETFRAIWRAHGFGPFSQIPRELLGADVQFKFRSPLHDAVEQLKAGKFTQMQQLVAEAASLDKNVYAVPDADVALRDALAGIAIPQTWMRTPDKVRQIVQQAEQADMQAQALARMQQGADVAATLQQAQQTTPPGLKLAA